MVQKEARVGFVITGLLLGIFVAAIDNTIVSTAMGTIIAQLGGLDKFVWVASAYMVTEMAGMPIFGKLSDMYGRKRFFIFGLLVFLLGSILCGTSQNIVQLIIYRAIQGIGGGAMMPVAFTILFDVVRPEQRGKMGGMFGAVFGLSSIFGPLLGAYLTDHITWQWVFYINLPFGIVTFVLIAFFYKESLVHAKQKVDWWGVFTLVPAIACLMFALQLGGNKYNWNSGIIIGLFVAAGVLFISFLYAETKAQDPIISYSMFKQRLFAGSNLVALFSGGAYVVAVLYIPIFIQGVMGGSATNSGLILLPMMLASVVASQVGSFMASKMSFRSVMLLFCLIFSVGIYLLSTLTPGVSRVEVTLFMIVTGFGIGASFSVLSIAVMQSFDERQRGTASATMNFVRELAMAVGITVYGIIQRNAFSDKLSGMFAGMESQVKAWAHSDPHAMLSPATRVHIPGPVLNKLMSALSSSITHTFLWTLVPALLSLVFVFYMSGERMMGFSKPKATEPDAQGLAQD